MIDQATLRLIAAFFFGVATTLFLGAFLEMTVEKPKPNDSEASYPLYRRTGLSWAVIGDDTGLRVATIDGKNQFTVVRKGEKVWSGSLDEFLALVDAGMKAGGGE